MFVGKFHLISDGYRITIPTQFRQFVETETANKRLLLMEPVEFGGFSAIPISSSTNANDSRLTVTKIDPRWRLRLPVSVSKLLKKENTRALILLGLKDKFEIFSPSGWEEIQRGAENDFPDLEPNLRNGRALGTVGRRTEGRN